MTYILRALGRNFYVTKAPDKETYGTRLGPNITLANDLDPECELTTLGHELAHAVVDTIYTAESEETTKITEGQACFVVEEVLRILYQNRLIGYTPQT